MAESFDPANLPHFRDRLPDLLEVLQIAGERIYKLTPKQSYIPYWEDLYSVLHSLKSVTKILPCEPELAAVVIDLYDCVLSAYGGLKIVRDYHQMGSALIKMRENFAKPSTSFETLQNDIQAVRSLLQEDIPHSERLKQMPPHLFYVNEFVSKKFREAQLLAINHCIIEDEVLLHEIPDWRKRLDAFLDHPEFGRGFVINFLPFISSEGSRKVKLWAWIALATPTRATLKQRIKESMPQVLIGKI